MSWLSDHIVWTTLLGLGVIIVAAIAMFRYLSRRIQDQQPPNPLFASVFTVTMGGLVALVFGVFLNGLLAHKRDRDGRYWSARQQHLARLQPLLRADADTFPSLSQREGTNGFFIDPRALGDGRTADYQRAWQSDNPLTGDLRNHFGEYAEARQQFVAAVESHDRELNTAHIQIVKLLIPMLAYEGRRDQVAGAILQTCLGRKGEVFVHVDGGSYSYGINAGWANMSGSGAGPPPPDLVASARAARSFTPTAVLKAECARLQGSAKRIVETAITLGKQARELSEKAILSGGCAFVERGD